MIVSCGSLNMDLVTRVARAPAAGETVLGSDYATHHGGKGGNQAVAAARLGANVRMVGAVGTDAFGEALLAGLTSAGVNASFVRRLDGASGAAFITIEEGGENRIIVSPGANAALTPPLLNAAAFAGVGVLLLQLEIPLETALAAARLGREAGAAVVLNAAPALPGLLKHLGDVDVLVVNGMEAGVLLSHSGAEAPEEAKSQAQQLVRYVPAAVITLGGQGAAWCEAGCEPGILPAFPVEVTDTTGAGDAFTGALGVALSEGVGLPEAVRFASAAGAIATTGRGARTALPERRVVEEMLARVNGSS